MRRSGLDNDDGETVHFLPWAGNVLFGVILLVLAVLVWIFPIVLTALVSLVLLVFAMGALCSAFRQRRLERDVAAALKPDGLRSIAAAFHERTGHRGARGRV